MSTSVPLQISFEEHFNPFSHGKGCDNGQNGFNDIAAKKWVIEVVFIFYIKVTYVFPLPAWNLDPLLFQILLLLSLWSPSNLQNDSISWFPPSAVLSVKESCLWGVRLFPVLQKNLPWLARDTLSTLTYSGDYCSIQVQSVRYWNITERGQNILAVA